MYKYIINVGAPFQPLGLGGGAGGIGLVQELYPHTAMNTRLYATHVSNFAHLIRIYFPV